jgi:hypothetical protein
VTNKTFIIKVMSGLAALATAIGGMVVAFTGGGEEGPQPIVQIIIQGAGDYQEFVDNTDLEYYQHLKGS